MARKIDASGLEKRRRAAQVEYNRRLITAKREQEAARKRKAETEALQLSKIQILTEAAKIDKLSVPTLQDQLNVLCQSDTEIPNCTAIRKMNKAAVVVVLKEAVSHYLECPAHIQSSGQVPVVIKEPQDQCKEDECMVIDDDWDAEDADMEED